MERPSDLPLPKRVTERLKVEANGCWTWQGARHEFGYGLTFGRPGQPKHRNRMVRVHRLVFEAVHGKVPAGRWVLHSCDNPPCANPAHLFEGCATDNARDMASKGRQIFQRRPERAPRGHRNGRAKLTADAVREIRRRRAAGETLASLAASFGIGTSQVGRIARREEWADA